MTCHQGGNKVLKLEAFSQLAAFEVLLLDHLRAVEGDMSKDPESQRIHSASVECLGKRFQGLFV